MGITPEKHIYLSPTKIDAQFTEKGMLAHFQNTCKGRSVKIPKAERRWGTPQWEEHRVWEYVEFCDANGEVQCKYKISKKSIGGEEIIGENVHIVWYRDKDGKKYVGVSVDPSLLED
jgi:hypothetical protein